MHVYTRLRVQGTRVDLEIKADTWIRSMSHRDELKNVVFIAQFQVVKENAADPSTLT